MSGAIRLVVSDVDGTLVRSDKSLSEASVRAVGALQEAGIAFAITSGRPPRGMAMLVDPLTLTTPIGGFNGGLMVDPEMAPIEQRQLPADLVADVFDVLATSGLDVWSYRGNDWFVPDPDGPHVAKEAATVQFAPTVRTDLRELTEGVVKVVGVSDDAERITRATQAMREAFGHRVSATPSQPYYLDVTHPDANKGCVVRFLAECLGTDHAEIAAIGDAANDVLMFAHAGLSIAMGNADVGVQRAAKCVTRTNDDDGFAHAVEHFILGR